MLSLTVQKISIESRLDDGQVAAVVIIVSEDFNGQRCHSMEWACQILTSNTAVQTFDSVVPI